MRPLVPCDCCGRHVRRGSSRCPFCSRARPSRLRSAIVAAAFFGSAAIAGCAYGPPPDDEEDGDVAAEVQAETVTEVEAEAAGGEPDGVSDVTSDGD